MSTVDIPVSMTSPVQPHEMDKAMRRGLRDMAARVAAACVMQGDGRDLLMRIYIAGLYHGATVAKAQVIQKGEQ